MAWKDDSIVLARLADDFNDGIPFDLEEYRDVLDKTEPIGFSTGKNFRSYYGFKEQEHRKHNGGLNTCF